MRLSPSNNSDVLGDDVHFVGASMEHEGLFKARRASQHVVQTKQLQFAMCSNLLKSSPVLYLHNEPVGTALFLFYFSCLFYLNILKTSSRSSASNSVVWSLKMTLKASVLLTSSLHCRLCRCICTSVLLHHWYFFLPPLRVKKN